MLKKGEKERKKRETKGEKVRVLKTCLTLSLLLSFDGKLGMGHRAKNVFIAPSYIINRFLTLLLLELGHSIF